MTDPLPVATNIGSGDCWGILKSGVFGCKTCSLRYSNTLGPCDLCQCSWSTTVYDSTVFCDLVVWSPCRSWQTDGLHFCSTHTVFFLVLLGVFGNFYRFSVEKVLLACEVATCPGFVSLYCVWVGFWWSISVALLTGVESPSPANYHPLVCPPVYLPPLSCPWFPKLANSEAHFVELRNFIRVSALNHWKWHDVSNMCIDDFAFLSVLGYQNIFCSWIAFWVEQQGINGWSDFHIH